MAENESPLPSPRPTDDGKRTVVDGKAVDIGGEKVQDDTQETNQFARDVEADLLKWRTLRDSGSISQSYYEGVERIAFLKLRAYASDLETTKRQFGYFRDEVAGEVRALIHQHQTELRFKRKTDDIAGEWLRTRKDANRESEKEVADLAAESLKNNGEKGGENDDVLMGYDEKIGNYPIDVATFEIRLRTDDIEKLDSTAFAHYLAWVQQDPASRQSRLERCLSGKQGRALAAKWSVDETGTEKKDKSQRNGETMSMRALRGGVAAKMGVDAEAAIALAHDVMAKINAQTFASERTRAALTETILAKMEEKFQERTRVNSNDAIAQSLGGAVAGFSRKGFEERKEKVRAMVDQLWKTSSPSEQAKIITDAGFKNLKSADIADILEKTMEKAGEERAAKWQSGVESFLRKFSQSPLTMRASTLEAVAGGKDALAKVFEEAKIRPDEFLIECKRERLEKLVAVARRFGMFDVGHAVDDIISQQDNLEQAHCESGQAETRQATALSAELALRGDPDALRESQKLIGKADEAFEAKVRKSRAALAAARREVTKRADHGKLTPQESDEAVFKEFDKLNNDPAHGSGLLAELEKKELDGQATPAERELLASLRELAQARAQGETAQLEMAQTAIQATRNTGLQEPEWARQAVAAATAPRGPDAQAAKKMESLGIPDGRLQELRAMGSWEVSPAGALVADEGTFTLRLDEKTGSVVGRPKGGVAEVPFEPGTGRGKIEQALDALHDLRLDQFTGTQLSQLVSAWNRTLGASQRLVLGDGLSDAATGNADLAGLTDLSEIVCFGRKSPAGETLETRKRRISTTPWTDVEARLNGMKENERFYALGELRPAALEKYFRAQEKKETVTAADRNDRQEAEKAVLNWPPV